MLKTVSAGMNVLNNLSQLRNRLSGITSMKEKAAFAQAQLKSKIDESTAIKQIKVENQLKKLRQQNTDIKNKSNNQLLNEELTKNEELIKLKKQEEVIDNNLKRLKSQENYNKDDETALISQKLENRQTQKELKNNIRNMDVSSLRKKQLDANIEQIKSHEEQLLAIDREGNRRKMALDNEFDKVVLNNKIKSSQEIATSTNDIILKNNQKINEEEITLEQEKQLKLNEIQTSAMEKRYALTKEMAAKGAISTKGLNLNKPTPTTKAQPTNITSTVEEEVGGVASLPVEPIGQSLGQRIGKAAGAGFGSFLGAEMITQIGVAAGSITESQANFISAGVGLGTALLTGFKPQIMAGLGAAAAASGLELSALLGPVGLGLGVIVGVGLLTGFKTKEESLNAAVQESVNGIKEKLNGAFQVGGFVSDETERMKTEVASQITVIANNFKGNADQMTQNYTNAFQQTGSAFQS